MKVGIVLVGGLLVSVSVLSLLCDYEKKIDLQREKGNIKCHKPCKLNNKTAQRDSYCVSLHLWHFLPQPTSYYLLLPVPYSSPATHFCPSLCPPPHLYKQRNSAGDSVQTGSIPFGHVVVMSHQAPAICVSVSLSFPLWVVYNIEPPVHTQLPLLQLLLFACCGYLCGIVCLYFYTTACPWGSRRFVPKWCRYSSFQHKVRMLQNFARLKLQCCRAKEEQKVYINTISFSHLEKVISALTTSCLDCRIPISKLTWEE